jgi:PAS domain S-box-containing protein
MIPNPADERQPTAVERLHAEHAELRRRLEEAEETIHAIQSGTVDAFVVEEAGGHRIYTLEAADRPYRLFVEQMQQGAATVHADGTIVYCNQQLADLLKIPSEKLIGASLGDFFAADDRSIYENLLWQGQVQSGRGDARLRRGDGGLLPVYLTFSALPKDCGAITGVLITDLTTQRHHEQLTAAHEALVDAQHRLQHWNVELEKAVNAKTDELFQSQERLRALATELNLAEQRERKRLATELHDYLQQTLVLGKLTVGQGKRAHAGTPAYEQILQKVDGIFSEALTYTRTLVTELSPPVLREHGLVAGLKWLGEYMLKHEQTVTVIALEDHNLTLTEDQMVLLFQSVRELLINSSKHAGTSTATVSMAVQDGYLEISVQDEGVGFDFAPTATAAGTSSGEISSKFGLFSIQERMRALGGTFNIRSGQGQGTTATLRMPFAKSAETKASVVEWSEAEDSAFSLKHAKRSPTKVRVLLVDDHTIVRQGLRAMLNAYTDIELIGEAGHGEEAVRLVDQLRPEIVVMDINMPKMNGIEATTAIKRRHPEITILGLSVNTGGDNKEAMLKAGASRLLNKESAVEQLYDAIHDAVSKG